MGRNITAVLLSEGRTKMHHSGLGDEPLIVAKCRTANSKIITYYTHDEISEQYIKLGRHNQKLTTTVREFVTFAIKIR